VVFFFCGVVFFLSLVFLFFGWCFFFFFWGAVGVCFATEGKKMPLSLVHLSGQTSKSFI